MGTLVIRSLFLFIVFLYAHFALAQPYTPHVIWDRSGITDSSSYGTQILPLGDQNNDGFNDWAVMAWGNIGYHGTQHGYLEFFHGGETLTQAPYLVFHGDPDIYGPSWSVLSVGDVNGDGYQDWLIWAWPLTHPANYLLPIYFGGPQADTLPDAYVPTTSHSAIFAMGDFNRDGFSDLFAYEENAHIGSMYFGGSPMDTTADWVLHGYPQGLNGLWPYAVGDFNGDGASDFMCFNPNPPFNMAIFLGGVNPDTVPAYFWSNMQWPLGCVKSLNGDDADEFLLGLGMHFGRSVLQPNADVTLNSEAGNAAVSAGDFNHDGYNDLILFTPTTLDNMFGALDLHLGHPWLNSDPVFTIEGWTDPLNLIGIYTAAGLGDVNGDGIDDIAIGAWDDFAYLGWRGRCVILSGDTTMHVPVTEPDHPQPSSFSLSCYPNPFNASTTISFTLPQAGEVKINVYDVLGRAAKSAQPCGATMFTAGEHHITFDGSALPSGIYFVQVQCGMYHATQKLMLLK